MKTRAALTAALATAILLGAGSPCYGAPPAFSQIGRTALPTDARMGEILLFDRRQGVILVGTRATPGRILKYRAATANASPRLAGDLALPLDLGNIQSGVIDERAGVAYFGLATNPGHIVKVAIGGRNGPPQLVHTLTLGENEGAVLAAAIDETRNIGYFCVDSAPVSILALDLGPTRGAMSRAISLRLDPLDLPGFSLHVDPQRGKGWLINQRVPMWVVQFSLLDGPSLPVREGHHQLPAHLGLPVSTVYNPFAEAIVIGCASSDAFVTKVDLSGPLPVTQNLVSVGYGLALPGTITASPGARWIVGGTHRTDGKPNVLFTLDSGEAAGSMGRIARTLIPANYGAIYRTAAFDERRGIAYFATNTDPGGFVFARTEGGPNPDLAVRMRGVTVRQVAAGREYRARVTVANRGAGRAGFFVTQLYLSSDEHLSPDDIPIGPPRAIRALSRGQARSLAVRATLPGVAPGTYYVIAETDPADIMRDANRTNNLAVSSALAIE